MPFADKGYNNAREIEVCQIQGITTIVAQQEITNSNDKGTTKEYLEQILFIIRKTDTYTCPQGQTLSTTGTWHTKQRSSSTHQFKIQNHRLQTRPAISLCTAKGWQKRSRTKSICRSPLMRTTKLQRTILAIPQTTGAKRAYFGTIKRVWGYYYTNLKGLKKVNGEWSLILTVYNMKRTLNILGFDELMAKLKARKPKYRKASGLFSKTGQNTAIIRTLFLKLKLQLKNAALTINRI